MSDKCTNIDVGKKLAILDFSFRKSTAEQQQVYKQHLTECEHCSKRALKAGAKRRLRGLLNILGGVGLAVVGLFIPFPGAWLMGLLAGLVWVVIGLLRLISGRD